MLETRKILLIVEYDGSRYHGFQWQAGLASIQGELEKAICRLTGEECRVIGASRTDAGVHAKGQVVSFRTGSNLPPRAFVSGLNYYLPGDIAVKEAHRADDSFDVRREAISREYRYNILNSLTRSPTVDGFAYRVAGNLDIDSMNRACKALIGEHDFASFLTGDGTWLKSTVRYVYKAGIEREGALAVFNIEANSFLPHQVRNTVGALIRVGLNKMGVDEFNTITEDKMPGRAGPTVPAAGLCLNRVNYPGSLGRDDEDL